MQPYQPDRIDLDNDNNYFLQLGTLEAQLMYMGLQWAQCRKGGGAEQFLRRWISQPGHEHHISTVSIVCSS